MIQRELIRSGLIVEVIAQYICLDPSTFCLNNSLIMILHDSTILFKGIQITTRDSSLMDSILLNSKSCIGHNMNATTHCNVGSRIKCEIYV